MSVRPLSVLVVDGYPDAAATLALLLNCEGFSARAALSGEEALAAVAAEPPEVVIVEPRTPGGGWDLARRLALPVVGERPLVVALTTDTTAAGREAADTAGVGLYLVKPESPTVLVRALRGVRSTTAPDGRWR
jgi:CheY-like chemotaxis protein